MSQYRAWIKDENGNKRPALVDRETGKATYTDKGATSRRKPSKPAEEEG